MYESSIGFTIGYCFLYCQNFFFFLARTFWHATLVPNVVCVWFVLYSNLFLYFLAFLAAWQSMPFKLIIKNNNVAAKIETKLKQSGGKHSDLGSR